MDLRLVALCLGCFALNGLSMAASWNFNVAKGQTLEADKPEFNAVIVAGAEDKILADGLFGKAFISSTKNTARVEHHDELSLVNNFTVRCVFRPDLVSGYRTLFWKGSRAMDPQQINYYVSIHDGKPEFKFKDSSGEWHVYKSPKPLVHPKQWYVFVITMDQEGMIRGYLNGNPCFAQKYALERLTPNRQPMFIGAGETPNGTGFHFDGLIDEISINQGVAIPNSAEKEDFKRRNQEFKQRNQTLAATIAQREEIERGALVKELMTYAEQSMPVPAQLQKMTSAELTALKKKYDFQRAYAPFHSRNKGKTGMVVSTLDTAERIVDLNDYLNGSKHCRTQITLSAARNEREGFQVILMAPPDQSLTGVRIELPELRATNGSNAVIPVKDLEWGEMARIGSTLPDYPVDYVGTIPDAILEGQSDTVAIPASGFTPIYVRIGVGAEVAAGDYAGKLKIISGNHSEEIGVKLHVYDFTLPVTTSCKVIFSFFENFYAEWYGIANLNDQQKMAIYDFLLRYRISPNNIYSPGIYPELKFMQELKRKGANFCTLGYINGTNMLSHEELDRKLDILGQRIAAVNKAGISDITYLYAFDELLFQPEGTKQCSRQFMSAFKQTFSDIKTIQTSLPEKTVLSDYDIFVPLFQAFKTRQDIIVAGRKAGKTLWWYAADDPHKPFPNFFLDYPVFDNRIIFTLSYMYDIEGILYWCINREWTTNQDIRGQWPEKPWKPYIISVKDEKRKEKNGMGNYVYPGKDGRILPSLRLENLRDGVEDYEYLVMLKNKVAILRNEHPESKLLIKAESLLRVPADVAISVAQYSADPVPLFRYRAALAEMIEQINHELQP